MFKSEQLYYKRIVCNDDTPVGYDEMSLLTPKYVKESDKEILISNLQYANFLLIDAFCPVEKKIMNNLLDHIQNIVEYSYSKLQIYSTLVRYKNTVAAQLDQICDYFMHNATVPALAAFIRFLLNHIPEQKKYIQKSVEKLDEFLTYGTGTPYNIEYIYLFNLAHLLPQHDTDENKLYFMIHYIIDSRFYGMAHLPISIDFMYKYKDKIIDYDFILCANLSQDEFQKYLEFMELYTPNLKVYEHFVSLQPNLEQMEKYLPIFKLSETFIMKQRRNIISLSNNNLKQAVNKLNGGNGYVSSN